MTRAAASKLWSAWAMVGVSLEIVTWSKGEDGATLSSHVWDLGHIPHRSPIHPKIRQAFAGAFLGWVVVHFLSGGKI